MEERYQARWDVDMMTDYYWNIMRDYLDKFHARKSKKRSFVCIE